MKVQLITANSTGIAVELSTIKDHLHIPLGRTEHDDVLKVYRAAAVQRVEHLTNRKLLTQTWKAYFDCWPKSPEYDSIYLPYPPLQSVPSTGIVYTMSSGGSAVLSATAWDADTVSEPGRVVLDYNSDWPSQTLHNYNPISVRFVCGYGDQSTEIPEMIRLALLRIVADWFEHREDTITGTIVDEVKESVKRLLYPYKVYGW